MPELPEVEVTRAGIAPHIVENIVASVSVHTTGLRWPISPELAVLLPGQKIHSVERRGKYLLLHCLAGTMLIHLGMTGYLRILPVGTSPGKHDHFDVIFNNGILLRLNDVRRFGSVVWAGSDPHSHCLLRELGPEPLTEDFDGPYLYKKGRSRKVTVKQFIMDHKMLAGVGNIYANEALFHAGIRPTTPIGRLSNARCVGLVASIKSVLTTSIKVGGTMLDFRDGNERYGYFLQELAVYKRNGEPCRVCATPILVKRLGQRSIYYCKTCQR